ncbi:MAG: XRE family transcriptional regulator [Trueperaceae bacterium]|nr:XRE family transcriptional regulator [Trueperaceae bacterium]
MIRQARERAGLTQAELARRSGVAQSSISAYEREVHQPSLESLQELIAATGHKVSVDLMPEQERPPTDETTLGLLRGHREELLAVGGELGVRAIRVFGSVARGDDGPDSDVDLLVELAEPLGYLGLARIEEALSAVIGRRVEIVPTYALGSEASRSLEASAVPL